MRINISFLPTFANSVTTMTSRMRLHRSFNFATTLTQATKAPFQAATGYLTKQAATIQLLTASLEHRDKEAFMRPFISAYPDLVRYASESE